MTLTDAVKVITGLRLIAEQCFMQIEIHNLTKVYGEKRGLLPTSLEIEKGELIAVIGPKQYLDLFDSFETVYRLKKKS